MRGAPDMPIAWLLAGGWRYLLIGVGALAAIGWYFQIQRTGALKERAFHFQTVANDNAATALQAQADHKKADAEAAKAATDNEMLRRKNAELKRKIADAPVTDDGPVAPVLRAALDSLPQPTSHETSDNPARRTGVAFPVSR